MDWAADCAVVIPCLDEAASIAPLVLAARRLVPNVIVVDDGSSDATRLHAERAGAEVLRHEVSQGKGVALQEGWQRARMLGFSWVLAMDGDGQHSPEDIPLFFDCAEASSARLVAGNRMIDPHRMPPLRRWVNRWMSGRLSQLSGQAWPDSQCGFRLIHLESLAQVPISASHFQIESDTLLAFARAGFKIQFVPIQVIYKSEQSKIHPLTDTIRWLRWWRQVRHLPSPERRGHFHFGKFKSR